MYQYFGINSLSDIWFANILSYSVGCFFIVLILFFFLNWIFIYLFIYLFIYFLAVLGLRFCARAFSSCSERGPLFIAMRGPPTVAASPVAEHKL